MPTIRLLLPLLLVLCISSARAQVEVPEGLPIARSADDSRLVPVVIYQTNDIHGRIGAVPANTATGAPATGGAASLATVLKREAQPYLWLDSGDWFQGTPVGNLTKGNAVMAIFSKLGLTATELGNHDFDYGLG